MLRWLAVLGPLGRRLEVEGYKSLTEERWEVRLGGMLTPAFVQHMRRNGLQQVLPGPNKQSGIFRPSLGPPDVCRQCIRELRS